MLSDSWTNGDVESVDGRRGTSWSWWRRPAARNWTSRWRTSSSWPRSKRRRRGSARSSSCCRSTTSATTWPPCRACWRNTTPSRQTWPCTATAARTSATPATSWSATATTTPARWPSAASSSSTSSNSSAPSAAAVKVLTAFSFYSFRPKEPKFINDEPKKSFIHHSCLYGVVFFVNTLFHNCFFFNFSTSDSNFLKCKV